ARTAGATEKAQAAVAEGLHMARQCGLGLYRIELLCEQAEIHLASGDPVAAEQAAREALDQASAAECQFMWGASQAGHLLGQALSLQERYDEARELLHKTQYLRRRIGDPGAAATERLLATLPR